MIKVFVVRSTIEKQEIIGEYEVPSGHSLSVYEPRKPNKDRLATYAVVTYPKSPTDDSPEGSLSSGRDFQLRVPVEDFWKVFPDKSVVHFVITESGGGGFGGALGIGIVAPFIAGAFQNPFRIGINLANNAYQALNLFNSVRDFLRPPSLGGGGEPETGVSPERDSPTYGFDGIQNNASLGAAIPVAYGDHDVGGQIIQIHKEASADARSEILFMLLAVSEGPIAQYGRGSTVYTSDQNNLTGSAIPEGMRINRIEASTLSNVFVSLRMGTQNQSPLPDFLDVVNATDFAFALQSEGNGRPLFEWETRTAVDKVDVNLAASRGLFATTQTGTRSASVRVRLRVLTTDLATTVFNQTFTLSANSRNPAYFTIRARNLPIAKYIIRVDRV